MLYGDDLAFIQASGFSAFGAAAVAELIPTLENRGAKRVIDVGCGAGVTTRVLLDAGFEARGIEPSAALLAIARQRAPSAEFQRASAYEAELGACDAILAVGEPLTYHVPDSDAESLVRGFFRKARRALRHEGLLVFDVIEVEGESLEARGWTSAADWAVLYETREDRAARTLTRSIETFRRTEDGNYRRGSEVHHVRLFERNDVTRWLELEGFDVEVATAYGRCRLPPRRVAFIASVARQGAPGREANGR